MGFCIPLRLVKLNHRGTEHYQRWLSWSMWVILPTLRASTKGELSGGDVSQWIQYAWGPGFASPEPTEKAELACHPASHPSRNQRRLSGERACLSKSCSPTTQHQYIHTYMLYTIWTRTCVFSCILTKERCEHHPCLILQGSLKLKNITVLSWQWCNETRI